jgi:O-antigen/teichoic acid export membrane protein
VLFQKAGETQHRGGRLLPLYVKVTAGLFALIFLPALVLFIWAPELFTWIFGSQWLMAGEFAQSLILWLMFYFCNLPAVLFAQIIRIQRTFFFYDLVLLAGRALSMVLGGLYLGAPQTILLFASVGAVMNVCLILFVGYAVAKKEGHGSWREIRENALKR